MNDLAQNTAPAGHNVEGGFDVEIAIPFRSLRFPKKSEKPWGILLTRKFASYYVRLHKREGI